MKMLSKAIALAAKAFENKVDKAGQPYILHCIRVMQGVNQKDEEMMCAAVLHDLIEDCGEEYSFEYLRTAGFTDRTVNLVAAVTHDKAVEDYDSYIKNIARNPYAKVIKRADLKDNMDMTRLKGLSKKDIARMERYYSAWVYLND